MKHKFAAGEIVEFMPNRTEPHVPPGLYKIVKQLPMDGLDYQYRVKNTHDGHERILRESLLTATKSLMNRFSTDFERHPVQRRYG